MGPSIEVLGRAGVALSVLRAEVKYECERQEVWKHLVMSKKMTRGRQHQKIDFQRKIYEELKELEEQRAK